MADNLCYLNAAVQFLYNSEGFRLDLLKYKVSYEKKSAAEQVYKVFDKMHRHNKDWCDLLELKKSLQPSSLSISEFGSPMSSLESILISIHSQSNCQNSTCPVCANFMPTTSSCIPSILIQEFYIILDRENSTEKTSEITIKQSQSQESKILIAEHFCRFDLKLKTLQSFLIIETKFN